MSAVDGLHRFSTHIQLHAHIRRHGVDEVAALSDDGMHAHHILLAEGFAQRVDAHQAQHSCIQSVDALVRRIGSMRSFANIAHGLAHKAIGAIADRNGGTGHIFIRMHLHCHINIVESAFVNQLALAAQEMQLASLQQLFAIFNFDIFFSRHAKENYITSQLLEHAGLHNAAGSAQHRGDLQIVTASMRSTGQRVGLGAFGTAHSVQLA